MAIAGSIVLSILKAVLGLSMMNSINIPGVEANVGINPDFNGIFDLVILVLGEVFRIGAKMQEEQDLTV